jgi:membrane-associated phospholipid phosphatase
MRSDACPAVVPRLAPPLVNQRLALARATAVACALGLVAVGVAALAVGAGHARDATILRGFTGLYGSSFDAEIRLAARLSDPVPYALLGLLCITVALTRGRTSTATATAVVLVGTGVTAQVLKRLLGQPRYAPWLLGDSMQNAWPSGHATAAMTLSLCAVMVSPPAWRAVTALFACGYTVVVAYATLALTWHYPSDVLAGLLVAGFWISAALAVQARLDVGPLRATRPPMLGLVFALGGAGVLVAAALVGVASERVALDTGERTTAVVGALTIAALALALLVITAIVAPEPDR